MATNTAIPLTYRQQHYRKNLERIRLQNKRYKHDHRPELQAAWRNYYWDNREDRKAYARQYYDANRDKCNEYSRQYRMKHGHTPKQVFGGYRKGAKKRGYGFALTFEQFLAITEKACWYCGATPAKGIDRIINEEGYTAENSRSCCWNCNRAKATLTTEEFLCLATKIARLHAQN